MRLKRITLEYEDASPRPVGAADLDPRVHQSLAAAGLCDPPAGISPASHYLVLEWKDGWKEVLAVESAAAELIRYYVIRRIEDVGRIALDVGAEYPRLIIVNRIPADLARLLLVDRQDAREYRLEKEIETYEGIFEAGGKKEYRRYDRAVPLFNDLRSEDGAALQGIKDSILKGARGRGLSRQWLLDLDEKRRAGEYSEIARLAGISGFEKQSDVCGFIAMVLLNHPEFSQ